MEPNQGYCYRLQLDDLAKGHTALSFLCARYTHSTAAEWAARIRRGQVLIDGKPVKEDQALQAGLTLVWKRPGWLEKETPRTYQRIYQDKYLLAVDKPSGLPTLPGAGFYRNTLLHLVQTDFPEARPLHRLGRGTSGIVLFARTRAAARGVSRVWPTVEKQYRALCSGCSKQAEYDIQEPIGQIPHPTLGQVYATSDSGKSARSVARVLQLGTDTTLFEVDLHTGRPHQIRIHLASIGHPLLGDPMYRAGGGLLDSPGLPGDLGYSLHATRLRLMHPISGHWLELHSAPPQQLCRTNSDSVPK